MMVLYPRVQKKAQEEIDSVVGAERLPDFEDEKSLPYIHCLIKELLRINPIVPLIPHSLDEDDIYRGWRIPKGAWVMANLRSVWCFQSRDDLSIREILTDEYPEPFFIILIHTRTRRSSGQNALIPALDSQRETQLKLPLVSAGGLLSGLTDYKLLIFLFQILPWVWPDNDCNIHEYF